MFDLGRSFLAAVERRPDALAIVDGERRLSYGEWRREIGRVAAGLAALGLKRGDRLAVILQNRLEISKSPVGKILRRLLVAGEYRIEQ